MAVKLIQNKELPICEKIGKAKDVEVQEIAWEGDIYYCPGFTGKIVPKGHLAIELKPKKAYDLASFFRELRKARSNKHSIA